MTGFGGQAVTMPYIVVLVDTKNRGGLVARCNKIIRVNHGSYLNYNVHIFTQLMLYNISNRKIIMFEPCVAISCLIYKIT